MDRWEGKVLMGKLLVRSGPGFILIFFQQGATNGPKPGSAKLYGDCESFMGLSKALRGLAKHYRACQMGVMKNLYQQLAKKVRWKTVTNSLPKVCNGRPLLTACQEGAMENRNQQLAEKVGWKTVTNSLPRRCDGKPSPTTCQ